MSVVELDGTLVDTDAPVCAGCAIKSGVATEYVGLAGYQFCGVCKRVKTARCAVVPPAASPSWATQPTLRAPAVGRDFVCLGYGDADPHDPEFCDLANAEGARPCVGSCSLRAESPVNGKWKIAGPAGVGASTRFAVTDAPAAVAAAAAAFRAGDALSVAGDQHAADRAVRGADASPDAVARPARVGFGPPASGPGRIAATVRAMRIESTLRLAGVCSCRACVAFSVAHEADVLPLLAPAIAGRFAPGHGPAPEPAQKKPDQRHGVSHRPIVARPRRGGK